MIVLIDNYDSFTYNLYQMLGSIREDIKVYRNDSISVSDLLGLHPDGIVVSPGPGRPEDAGISVELIRTGRGLVPILGVCLGEQSIAAAYGAEVGYAPRLMHGKASRIRPDPTSLLFRELPEEIAAARYHSLVVREESLTGTGLIVTARAEDDGAVMAIEDRPRRVFGLQFHPESILTEEGCGILRNFLSLCPEKRSA